MGERYRAQLQDILEDLGPERLRAYLNPEGVSQEYKRHVEDTFRAQGVVFVRSREEANFVFDGHCSPVSMPGQVVAFFRDDALVLEGALV